MLRVFQKLVNLLALIPAVVVAELGSNMTKTMTMPIAKTEKLGHFQTPGNQNQNRNQDGNKSRNLSKILSSTDHNGDGFIDVSNLTRMYKKAEDWDSQHNSISALQNSLNYSYNYDDGPTSHRESPTGLTSLLMLPLAIFEVVVAVVMILISAIVLLFVPALLGLVAYGAGAALGYWDFFGYKIEIQEENIGFMIPSGTPSPW